MSTLGNRLLIFAVISFLIGASVSLFLPTHTAVLSLYRLVFVCMVEGLCGGFVVSYAYVEWHMTRVIKNK